VEVVNIIFAFLSNLWENFNQAICVILGGYLTYKVTCVAKDREIENTSLITAHQIAILLIKREANLGKIKYIINQGENPFVGYLIPKLKSDQSTLERTLQYKKFYEDDFLLKYAEVSQLLMASEQAYHGCCMLVKEYNTYSNQLMKLDHNDLSLATQIQKCLAARKFTFDNLKNKYANAVDLHKKAKKRFDALCLEVFPKRWKCSFKRVSKYQPIATGNIVEAIEL